MMKRRLMFGLLFLALSVFMVPTVMVRTALCFGGIEGSNDNFYKSRPAKTRNPLPLINQPLVPDAAKPGGKGFTLTVNGTGFVSKSVVKWNGHPRQTTFVSRSRLTANILASDIAKAHTGSVTVVNPSPGGGTSNPTFFEVSRPRSAVLMYRSADFGPVYSPDAVATADFNGDENLDLAVAAGGYSAVSVMLGNGDGSFQAPINYATGIFPWAIAIGDFNKDGKWDLAVVSYYTPGAIDILLGNGDGTFQQEVPYSTGSQPSSVAIGDFNGDGNVDLAVTNDYDSTVGIFLGNGDGTFQSQITYATPSNPFSVAIGDFNDDGNLDLAVASLGSNSVSVLLGNGDGTFRGYVDYATGGYPYSVVVGDFNGDGILDLAVANEQSNNVSVLLGNGDGTFQDHVDYGPTPGADYIATADFNGDEKLDLAVTTPGSNAVSVLQGNGDGTFKTPTAYGANVYSAGLTVGDFNRLGRLGLAVGNFEGNSASIFLPATTTAMVSPPSLSFANQVVGTSSPKQAVMLTNTGKGKLAISSIAITGSDAAEFAQKNQCPSSLPPEASCTINVTFKPTQVGPRSASLTITDTASGGPQIVPLNGTGVVSGPNATLSPTSLAFVCREYRGHCTCTQPQYVTLSNYGTKTLKISSIRITGSNDFSQTNNCAKTLGPGKFCTITVTWDDVTSAATLEVKDNAQNSPQTVPMTGQAQCKPEVRIDIR